jgi:hypothetical protein
MVVLTEYFESPTRAKYSAGCQNKNNDIYAAAGRRHYLIVDHNRFRFHSNRTLNELREHNPSIPSYHSADAHEMTQKPA